MLQIEDKHFIASGAFCNCYFHPETLDQCVKITTSEPRASKRIKADVSYYKSLYAKKIQLTHIPNYLGECQTNLGKGYLFECVRDYDDSISKTLRHYLSSNEMDNQKIYLLLDQLYHFLMNHNILISDIHDCNILIQKTSETTVTPMIIDGLGDRVAFKLLNIFPSMVKSKIQRRWQRFIKNLHRAYAETP